MTGAALVKLIIDNPKMLYCNIVIDIDSIKSLATSDDVWKTADFEVGSNILIIKPTETEL